jgi:8-oxo-dGTP pyrophosphatase MutT (NUDIX family)
MTEPSIFIFDHDPSVAEFAVSKHSYLTAHPEATFSYIATSALVLDTSDKLNPRILLLQRAASDSNPNKWEPPGGACDDDDESILHAAARELWEEAGLQATRIDGTIGEPYFFTLRNGGKVCQFPFAVRVEMQDRIALAPRLNPSEHQHFVWATENEVKAERTEEGLDLNFTREHVKQTLLLAYRHLREKKTLRGE